MYNKQVLHIPNTKEQRHTTTTIEHIVETKYHKSKPQINRDPSSERQHQQKMLKNPHQNSQPINFTFHTIIENPKFIFRKNLPISHSTPKNR